MKQFRANPLPWHGRGRVLLVRVQPRLKLLYLGGRERRSVRALGRNTVPDVLDKLNPLGYGEVHEVGTGPAHVGQNCRCSRWAHVRVHRRAKTYCASVLTASLEVKNMEASCPLAGGRERGAKVHGLRGLGDLDSRRPRPIGLGCAPTNRGRGLGTPGTGN